LLLKSISLQHFRNYRFQEVIFEEGISVFSGRNAQGKTNLLEAIHFLSTGRSFRTPRVTELIQQGSNHLEVCGIVEKEGSVSRLKIHYSERSKTAHINQRRVERFQEIVGVLNAVAFVPDDIDIVKGFPSERRRYLDMQIGQLKRGYLLNLYRYNEVVKQRNAALKARQKDTMAIWDEELVKYGTVALVERKSAVKRLGALSSEFYDRIVARGESLEMSYRTSIEGESAVELSGSFREKLQSKAAQELRSGITLTGPHRDDLVFAINGLDVRGYGSEGQRRSVAIALRLAQYELAKEISGDKPAILIDDVTAELDPIRKRAFMPLIRDEGQVFLATAADEKVLQEWKGAKVFMVENGKVF
jgi:DNA replication and repair protein RecF